MALIRCKDCGNDVSTKADSCPKCGRVLKRKTSALTGCLAVVILGPILVGILSALILPLIETGTNSSSGDNSTTSESPPPQEEPRQKSAEESRTEFIRQHFSLWDGSHDGLTKVIKASMNDPRSYQHVETRYVDMKDHLIVRTTFRGKNAFGGVVLNRVEAKVNLNGEVLEILEQSP